MDSRTVFDYHDDGDTVWANYSGGPILRGFLVGTRHGNRLDFRYCQLGTDGTTSGGHCTSAISVAPDGGVRLDEEWEWESRAGRGTSCLCEVNSGEPLT